jgi:hypothetical protein
VKENSADSSSLLQDITAQQNENVFLRAFSFSTTQLPVDSAMHVELADRIIMLDEMGFIFQLMEREQKVASKPGDVEKWITNQVVRRGIKQIQATRDLLKSYLGLSLVNNFGHRVLIAPKDPELLVSVIIYRVAPKTRAFRAARFKKNKKGGFVHILRDVDYFEIVQHFVTPAELVAYFGFRRDMLINWDPAATAVSEAALIGQYIQEDYSSPPDERFEKSSRARGGPTACEFSFVLDSLAESIASQDGDYADTDCYEILSELARLARHDLRALKHVIRVALEAVRGNRLELPYRIASAHTHCGFLVLPVTSEFHDRAFDALRSLSSASKYELDLEKQVGIGMWRDSEFVDIEWIFVNGRNLPDPDLDDRLARNYPFRRASEQRLPPIFV